MLISASHSIISRVVSSGNGTRSRESRALDFQTEVSDDAQRPLPDESEWIKDGILEKHVHAHSNPWQRRRVVLTGSQLCITREDIPDIVEWIDLGSMKSIHQAGPDFQDADAYSSVVHIRGKASLHHTAHLSSMEELISNCGSTRLEPEHRHTFSFKVVEAGGETRKLIFGAQSEQEAAGWVDVIKGAVAHYEKTSKRGVWRWLKKRAHNFYYRKGAQIAFSLIIVGNFSLAILNAQLVPEPDSAAAKRIENAGLAFTCLFTIEVLINLVAHWWWPFWADWWNCADAVVVVISLFAIPLNDVKGFSLLRMTRFFRVIRLFHSLRPLKTIVNGLTAAIVPVASAFLVLAVATTIYAVVGVGLYSELDPYHFGNFRKAIFTMFQTITMDSWSTSIVRPTFGPEGVPPVSICLFFVSYILIVGIFLLNAVVAVLLDEFMTSIQIEKAEIKKDAMGSRKQETCMDPLLVNFATCETAANLRAMIEAVYAVLDRDDSGGLTYEELREGLPRLKTVPLIFLSPENFEAITDSRKLCDFNGKLDIEGFDKLIRQQLKSYALRRSTFEMIEANHTNTALATVLLMLNQAEIQREYDRAPVERRIDRLERTVSGSSHHVYEKQGDRAMDEARMDLQLSELHSKLDGLYDILGMEMGGQRSRMDHVRGRRSPTADMGSGRRTLLRDEVAEIEDSTHSPRQNRRVSDSRSQSPTRGVSGSDSPIRGVSGSHSPIKGVSGSHSPIRGVSGSHRDKNSEALDKVMRHMESMEAKLSVVAMEQNVILKRMELEFKSMGHKLDSMQRRLDTQPLKDRQEPASSGKEHHRSNDNYRNHHDHRHSRHDHRHSHHDHQEQHEMEELIGAAGAHWTLSGIGNDDEETSRGSSISSFLRGRSNGGRRGKGKDGSCLPKNKGRVTAELVMEPQLTRVQHVQRHMQGSGQGDADWGRSERRASNQNPTAEISMSSALDQSMTLRQLSFPRRGLGYGRA